jgi:4a-hydroxytetrahydrobiopterin dehydratase
MPALPADQIKLRMGRIAGWSRRSRTIRRTFSFAGFAEAIRFVRKIADAAEAKDHHPDIDIRWNKVTLTLTTHSEGGLTAKDFQMARQCSGIFEGFGGR